MLTEINRTDILCENTANRFFRNNNGSAIVSRKWWRRKTIIDYPVFNMVFSPLYVELPRTLPGLMRTPTLVINSARETIEGTTP